jgi:PIN domain nuclease of toxin-antitoxin system
LRGSTKKVITESDEVFVSAATGWEIAIKTSIGKMELRGDLVEHLALNNFRSLNVTMAHAVAAAKLPRHHGDPFDRMLVAQASAESLTLLTTDHHLEAYGIPLILI